eukprot:6363990-Pyramimonas_sp.AAC.1
MLCKGVNVATLRRENARYIRKRGLCKDFNGMLLVPASRLAPSGTARAAVTGLHSALRVDVPLLTRAERQGTQCRL